MGFAITRLREGNMTNEATVASKCINSVSHHLMSEFGLESWEAHAVAGDVVMIVLQTLKEERPSDGASK